jgi:hypothetical protein
VMFSLTWEAKKLLESDRRSAETSEGKPTMSHMHSICTLLGCGRCFGLDLLPLDEGMASAIMELPTHSTRLSSPFDLVPRR